MRIVVNLEIDVVDEDESPYQVSYIGLADVGTVAELETLLCSGLTLSDGDIKLALFDVAGAIEYLE